MTATLCARCMAAVPLAVPSVVAEAAGRAELRRSRGVRKPKGDSLQGS